ncbi:MAG: DNA mismatch repair endonuclease MutL [Deltaproteobacteria bacterium]|nr:DNA mismatch repair endonuclease MutL [Deltaproteobacteria bacterium]
MTEVGIQLLDGLVADQIAAGEVVERPGSVVKELIENSLDAGATRIQLDIDTGGTARIRVLDNGAGIPEPQVRLAFERHATSKIRRLEDLEGVGTYGFRGEALPSISSVSKMTIRTRTADDVAGTMLRLEGGKVIDQREVGCPVGTDIEVADLFFNTPARLKFLKRASTEASHSSEALVRLAACRPDVSFIMTSGGRRIRDLPRVERIEERISSMFGRESLVRAEGQEGGVNVLAVLGPPERARAGAGSLYTYVDGRFIRDKTLLRAVTQAFGGTLESGRYPVGLIRLSMPPGSFDVNVHPQKTEVRFVDAQIVYRAVVRVVGEMVSRAAWTLGGDQSSKIAEVPEDLHTSPEPYRPSGRLVPPPVNAGATAPSNFPSPPRGEAGREAPPPIQDNQPLPHIASTDEDNGTPGRFTDLEYIGQAKGLFLLFESGDELVIIDQHAAHERVVYERLRTQLGSGQILSQRLLVPHNVDLGPADAERIVRLGARLERLGLEVAQSGSDRVTIHAVPAELVDASLDRLLADMVIALEERRDDSRGDMEDGVLARMACHSSLRGGRLVQRAEARALLEQMEQVDFAGHCPHGRPVLAQIPWSEIRRRVGRN